MSSEQESFDDFIERMSRKLVEEESEENNSIDEEYSLEEKKLLQRLSIIHQYFHQYFMGRQLETLEKEAYYFNSTFPFWKKVRAEAYKRLFQKSNTAWHLELASDTQDLSHEDAFLYCRRNISECDVKLGEVLAVTDDYRKYERLKESWTYLGDVVMMAGRFSAEGDGSAGLGPTPHD